MTAEEIVAELREHRRLTQAAAVEHAQRQVATLKEGGKAHSKWVEVLALLGDERKLKDARPATTGIPQQGSILDLLDTPRTMLEVTHLTGQDSLAVAMELQRLTKGHEARSFLGDDGRYRWERK
jgi:hypothetical protein